MSDSANVHAVAGAVSAAAALALTYPLTTITTRQQVATAGATEARAKEDAASFLKGLYGGLQPAVAGTFVSQGFYFYFFQVFKNVFERNGLAMTATNSLVVGSLAGAVNVLVTNPVWVVVTRMQTKDSSRTFTEVVTKMLEEEGIGAFWKGVVPSLILVSNPAIMYMVYEPSYNAAKKKLKPGENVPAFTTFLLGAIAKLVATLFTYPILTVKSRLQASKSSEHSPENPAKESVRSIIRELYRERGVPGLYKGIQAKIIQTVLNAAFTMMLKDQSVLYVVAVVNLFQLKKEIQTKKP